MSDWIQLVGGGILLYFGAEWFVGGASALALALRVPQIIIGLTVVAYGTSAPEVVVGVQAALAGRGAVTLGNVIGSNIANIGLILAIAALIRPARVDGGLRRRELPILLVSTALVPILLLDGKVTSWEALLLLLFAGSYTGFMIKAARGSSALPGAEKAAAVTAAAADTAGAPQTRSKLRSTVVAIFGLVVLLLGGNIFIEGAVSVALTLGMSERLVGLTIVAVGTSLPELVTSVIAARAGHSDIAIGNVVGSNIFNVFLCLGVSAWSGTVSAELSTLAFDLFALLVMTVFVAVCIRTERFITRAEGGLMLLLYTAFNLVLISGG